MRYRAVLVVTVAAAACAACMVARKDVVPGPCVVDADCPETLSCCAGACLPGSAVAAVGCSGILAQAQCWDTSCDDTGLCVSSASPNTTVCNDGSVCTSDDHCDGAGRCTGTPGVCACHDAGCACDTNAECVQSNLCLSALTCDPVLHVCQTGGPAKAACPPLKPGDADYACHVAACNPATGNCEPAPATDGPCDTGDACQPSGVCAAGLCVPSGESCASTNICETGKCVAGDCTYVPKPDGAPCGNGFVCVSLSEVDIDIGICVERPAHTVLLGTWKDWLGCGKKNGKCGETEAACGGTEEGPAHMVEISPFFMDDAEVTVARYAACASEGDCGVPATGPACFGVADALDPGKAERPQNCVTWAQARAFCFWAGGDLPTEAQWERAAGGGQVATDTDRYPWGSKPPKCTLATFKGGSGPACGTQMPFPVRKKAGGQTLDGIFDLAGNVAEWTRDLFVESWYCVTMAGGVQKDPMGPMEDNPLAGQDCRVVRGGSGNDPPPALRNAARSCQNALSTSPWTGFRCVYGVHP